MPIKTGPPGPIPDPRPRAGAKVTFVPLEDGVAIGEKVTFTIGGREIHGTITGKDGDDWIVGVCDA